jgi:hypothetical protein
MSCRAPAAESRESGAFTARLSPRPSCPCDIARQIPAPQRISHLTSMTACFGRVSSSASATTPTGCAAGLTSSGSAQVLVARIS